MDMVNASSLNLLTPNLFGTASSEIIAEAWNRICGKEIFTNTCSLNRQSDCSSLGNLTQDSGTWSLNGTVEMEQAEPINLCVRDALSLKLPEPESGVRKMTPQSFNSPELLEPLAGFGQVMERIQSAAWSAYLNILNGGQTCSPEPMDTGLQSLSQFCADGSSNLDMATSTSKLHTSTPLRGSSLPFINSNDCVQKPDSGRSLTMKRSERRRRVGWRGIAMCAVCDLVFSRMDQLNKHYEQTHSHLLEIECQLAEQTSTKASKLLFQAQLDRLRSEKVEADSSTAGAIKSRPDNHFESKLSEDECDPHGLYSSNYKSSSSVVSPTASLPASYSPESKISLNLGVTQSLNLCQSPQPDTGVSSSLSQRDGRGIKTYPCPSCNYTAKWPTELHKHVMVHANSRPFVCSVCSTTYKWSWDLGRHFSNAHPTLPNPYKRQRLTRKYGTPGPQKKPKQEIESKISPDSG